MAYCSKANTAFKLIKHILTKDDQLRERMIFTADATEMVTPISRSAFNVKIFSILGVERYGL